MNPQTTFLLRTTVLIGFCFLSFFVLNGQSQFSKDQILEDLIFLRSSLEETHYNLYAYTSKRKFERNFQTIKKSLKKDSFSLLEATTLFQRVISKANNGHTEISFPGTPYIEYAYAGGTIFPLEVALEDDHAFIRKNWSDNDEIEVGSELLRINGMPIAKVLSKIAPQLSAERPYFKKAKIEFYSLPRLYWQVFGPHENFEVVIRSEGQKKKFLLKAVKVIDGFEVKRTEVLNAEMNLKFYSTAAYLNPGNFSGDASKYQTFIDSAFAKIKEADSKFLILDLRNNGGGEDAFSDYLVAYMADRPFRWNSNFSLKSSALLKEQAKHLDTITPYWQSILDHKNGEIYTYTFPEYSPQPSNKRFTGKVFVLVNRQSHSQATVTAAQIKDYGFGTIVGEETGEYPSLYASQFQYPLPNTGITVNVSKGYLVRVNGSTAEEGLQPDIIIKDHLLDEKEEILEGLLQQIQH